jgi:D-alanine transaminase
MIVYSSNNFIPLENVKISPFDRGFQFGDGAYEVIRYFDKDFFKLEEHLNRLKYSLDELKINFHSYDKIKNIALKLLNENSLADYGALIYIQVTRGVCYPRIHSIKNDIAPTLFISASKFIRREKEINEGVKIIFTEDSRWNRCDIKSIMLLPNSMAKGKAIQAGASEAVFVREGRITEGSHTSFGAVIKGKVVFPPYSNFILRGVTRDTITGILLKNKFDIQLREISPHDSFDECFLLGTSTEVTPVIQAGNIEISGGKPGELTKKIQTLFNESTSGTAGKQFNSV